MAQIRGDTFHSEQASPSVIVLALALDLLIIAMGAGLVCFVADVTPTLSYWTLPAFVIGLTLLEMVLRWFGARTAGEWILDLRPAPSAKHLWSRWRVLARPGHPRRMAAGALTGALGLGLGLLVIEVWFAHPYYLSAKDWRIDPFLPASQNSNEWVTAPFYYSLAFWPKAFKGEPVFHSLPYQKGPPTVFVDHLIARWDYPEIQVRIEGPKTPLRLENREILRHCLQTSEVLCQEIRRVAISRHVQEMTSTQHSRLIDWSLRWFVVSNAALGSAGESQGFFLRAKGPDTLEERFIFVTPKGAHQTIALITPASGGPRVEDARILFYQVAASLRISDDLTPGRLWSEQQLRGLDATRARTFQEWSLILTVLLARVSISPEDYTAYYHLAGTAHRVLKQALAGHPQWVKPLAETILSAVRYAQDLAPNSPKNNELRALGVDAQKALHGEPLSY